MSFVNKWLRTPVNRRNIAALKNTEFSLISSNCNGGFMLHDLGLQFRSPTVNLWIPPSDFIRFLRDL